MERGYAILWRKDDQAADAVSHSLRALEDQGVPSSSILVVNLTGNPLPPTLLATGAAEWKLPATSEWRSAHRRALGWFGAGQVVWLAPGAVPTAFGLAHLPEAIGCFGPVIDSLGRRLLEADSNLRFDMTRPLNRPLVECFVLGRVVGEQTIVELQPSPSLVFEMGVFGGVALEPSPAAASPRPVVAAGVPVRPASFDLSALPAEVRPPISAAQVVGFWSATGTLGLDGLALDPLRCDLLIYRVTLADVVGLAEVLRSHRLGGVLREAVLLFDNGACQVAEGGKPFGVVGPLPYDMRREIGLAGFAVEGLQAYRCSPTEYREEWHGVVCPGDGWTEEERLMATARTLMVTAKPRQGVEHLDRLVSIVILALNKLEYTQGCIRSIQQHTRQRYELILVDNGSTDGTGDWFATVPGAKVIRNVKNLGVAAGWNQGIDRAEGDYLLILNNDTILGPGSLENLVRCAEEQANVGIVAPRSNAIAGPQMVEGFQFGKPEEIPARIAEWQQANDLAAWEFPRIKGFCMLIPRAVALEVGYFDERYGIGNFEDDDYSLRVGYRGKGLWVADDSFIFHFGSVSFSQAGIDWNAQMVKNQKLFEEKWKRGRLTPLSETAVAAAPVLAVAPVPPQDPAWELFRAGELVRAQELFRQRLSQGVEDADAYLGLGRIALGQGQVSEAFALLCRSLEVKASEEAAQAAVALLRERSSGEEVVPVLEVLVRRFPGLRALDDALAAYRGQSGELDSTWRARVEELIQSERYGEAQALLGARLAAGDEGFEVQNLLGILHYYRGTYDRAFDYFQQALRRNPTDQDTLVNFFDAGVRIRQEQKVLEVLEYALSLEPNLDDVRRCWEELRQAVASGHPEADRLIVSRERNLSLENKIREGMLEEAELLARQILADDPDNFRAKNNLGLIHWYRHEPHPAWDLFRESIEGNIWYTDAVLNLYDCSLVSRRLAEFMPLLERALAAAPGNRELMTIRREIKEGRLPERMESYRRDNAESKSFNDKLHLAKTALEREQLSEAAILFAELVELDPDRPEGYNGLGIVAYYWGSLEDAFGLLRKSVDLAPLDGDSLLNLWDVAGQLGQRYQVRERLENALAIDPTLLELRQALDEGGA